jgi:hypothetical protein
VPVCTGGPADGKDADASSDERDQGRPSSWDSHDARLLPSVKWRIAQEFAADAARAGGWVVLITILSAVSAGQPRGSSPRGQYVPARLHVREFRTCPAGVWLG